MVSLHPQNILVMSIFYFHLTLGGRAIVRGSDGNPFSRGTMNSIGMAISPQPLPPSISKSKFLDKGPQPVANCFLFSAVVIRNK